MPTREEIKARILARRDAQLQEDLRWLTTTPAGRRIGARVAYDLALRDLDQEEDLFAGKIKDGSGADAYRAFYIGKHSLGEAFERELRAANATGWALMRHERDLEFIADDQAIEQGDDSND
jgi:hypothetical protein